MDNLASERCLISLATGLTSHRAYGQYAHRGTLFRPGSKVLWAYSSAGEHFVDIEGVTGSIPVTPTINRRTGRDLPKAHGRREKTDESQELAPLAEAAPPGLPRCAPQGPRLRHQQDPASF